MTVYIMSGIPGSGKSSWAKNAKFGAFWHLIVSADDFFMENGEYKFDPSKLPQAHQDCFKTYIILLQNYTNDSISLIVDNTNLSAWEISPYYLAAETFGHDVTIVRIHCGPYTAFGRGTHGVPFSAVEAMYARFTNRDVLPWWKVLEIEQGG